MERDTYTTYTIVIGRQGQEGWSLRSALETVGALEHVVPELSTLSVFVNGERLLAVRDGRWKVICPALVEA